MEASIAEERARRGSAADGAGEARRALRLPGPQVFLGLAAQGHHGKDGYGKAQLRSVEIGVVAADRAGLFQQGGSGLELGEIDLGDAQAFSRLTQGLPPATVITADLARFARMLLSGGHTAAGQPFLSRESVALLTTAQSPPGLAEQRSLGWDMTSPYARPRGRLYPATSFGHTGFTGCAFWLDPGSRSFFVLLSNRVHPNAGTQVLPLYGELGTAAAQAAGMAPASGLGQLMAPSRP